MSNTVTVVNVDFPADLFGAEVNIPLMHQVVVAQRAAARQGTHATKTRGMVSGGGKKPYKQKGTGRARQGSIRAPQFTGGGVVHGPQPRSYSQRTPKKMVAAALRSALSDRLASGRVHVVAGLVSGDKPSTRAALSALTSLTDRAKFLLVLERSDALTWLSLRNAPEVHIVAVDQLNTYDVLASDDVVFTQGAFDAFVAARGNGSGEVVAAAAPAKAEKPAKAKAEKPAKAEKAEKPAKAEKAEKPAKVEEPAEAEAAAPVAFAAVADADIPGAAQPGPEGEAPEGYEIKGNKDSMLYHAPGGRWYDATIAEVWFKTAADAEAAGFTKAGARKKKSEGDDK